MKLVSNFCVVAFCVGVVSVLWLFDPDIGYTPLWGLALLFAWPLYLVIVARFGPPAILRLGGLTWSMDDFCRGWLITGRPGTGKTTAAINQMLWQISKNCPTWGGVCVDDKGLYWETLSSMFRQVGRQDDLILLQVRPEGEGLDWEPTHTFNFLDNRRLPDSAKAKIICDVAASLGQRSDQSFFKMQAQIQMEFAFKALRCADFPVTLSNTYEFLTSDTLLREVMAMVAKCRTPEAESLIDHFDSNLIAQPPEQLGGVKTTVANYLKYFTDPDIAAVFCPRKSSFNFRSIDRGKVICVSIPQRYQVERRYINTLLKLTFYSHALQRFDKAESDRASDNLIIFWADEAQRIVTASGDGMSDHNVVDVIREARATVVAATQSYTSLIPPMGDEQKTRVLIANLANRITFCAADEESAKIAADTLGKYEGKRRTVGYSGGQRTSSWTNENKYFLEPHEFRKLSKFHAVVQHCERGFRKLKLAPVGPNGKTPPWY
jgi:type IV secretory pathway TraG/TraD family ATPase VirD4